MAKTAKKAAPAVEKKTKVNKGIEKPKPAKKTVAKKAAVGGISGKYAGTKDKKPKAAAAAEVVSQPPKTDVDVKPKAAKKPRKNSNGRAVVKINSLPHGFFEEQLKGYFTQFGDVTNVKVVRSLKTGRSKGVAFVEFGVAEVAEIAAETMNNYLLFKNLLKTEYIAPSQVKPGLFAKKVEVVIKPDGTQTVKSAVISARNAEVRKHNAQPTEEQAKKRKSRLENKLKLKNKFLQKVGVDLSVESLVTGKVDLTTPVKAAGANKKPQAKKQNITVQVAAKEAVVEEPAQKKQKVAPVKKAQPAGKGTKTTATTTKAVAEKKQQKKTKPTASPVKKSPKALEKAAKRAEWLKESNKKKDAKRVAKTKEATKAAVVATPTPASVPVPAKKEKKAPVVKATAAAPAKPEAAPAKAPKAAAVKPKAKAAAAAVKVAKVKVASPQKKEGGGKKLPAVKKTIEKKKPLKLTPKKKSVK